MKILRIVALGLFVLSVSVSPAINVARTSLVKYSETPAKTVFIKHPDAADANSFFSKNTSLMFYVFKAGSADEVNKMIETIKKNKNVLNAGAGKVTGDYQEITVNLKSAKDKAFWVDLFKSAGLNHIKINNGDVRDINQL